MTTYEVFVLRCGTCGHTVSSLRQETTKALMLDHLVDLHSPDPIGDTERIACPTDA